MDSEKAITINAESPSGSHSRLRVPLIRISGIVLTLVIGCNVSAPEQGMVNPQRSTGVPGDVYTINSNGIFPNLWAVQKHSGVPWATTAAGNDVPLNANQNPVVQPGQQVFVADSWRAPQVVASPASPVPAKTATPGVEINSGCCGPRGSGSDA